MNLILMFSRIFIFHMKGVLLKMDSIYMAASYGLKLGCSMGPKCFCFCQVLWLVFTLDPTGSFSRMGPMLLNLNGSHRILPLLSHDVHFKPLVLLIGHILFRIIFPCGADNTETIFPFQSQSPFCTQLLTQMWSTCIHLNWLRGWVQIHIKR